MENDKIQAPFTQKQVDDLNFYQESGIWHPFTCGNSKKHPNISPALKATESGWRCLDETCEYTQDWVFKFMADRPLIEKRFSILNSVLKP